VVGSRLLLDTHVQDGILVANGVQELRKAQKAHKIEVVACPVVLDEPIGVRDSVKRVRRAKQWA
jgi:hypothetical protein